MMLKRYFALLLTMLLFQTHAFAEYQVEEGNESAFDEAKQLTEQEEAEAKTYIHNGIAEKEKNKLCDPNDPAKFDLCINQDNGFTDDDKFLGIKMQNMEKIVPILSQAYSLFGNMLKIQKYTKADKGASGKYVNKDSKAQPTNDKKKAKKEEQQDYCAMIPTATELISTATQGLKQDNIQQNYDNAAESGKSQQADALAAVAQAQKSRATTSTIQAGGWGASAACYGAMLAFGGMVANPSAIGKLAAAGILGSFYVAKAKAHKNRANAINGLIDDLPTAGQCNPHTNTSCFCNEETSQTSDPANYQKYCLPREYQDRYGKNSVSCLDANNKIDNECKCAKTKSCISSKFTTDFANLQFGTNSAIDPLSVLRGMESGLSDAELAAQTARNLAFAKKVLDQVKPDELSKMTLDNAQKEMADTLSKNGIPKIAAAAIASQPTSPKAASALGLNGSSNYNPVSSKKNDKSKAANYEGKSGSNNRFGKKSNTSSYNPFAKFGKKEATPNSAVQIEDYSSLADKAIGEAQISKDTSRPIFDIITYRYKLSAWKRFEDQINKEIQEEEPAQK